MLSEADISPTIQAVVTAVCGVGAIGYFLWQVFSRIKVDDRRTELDAEQKEDRSSLRRRNDQLEHKVSELQDRLIEATAASSGAGACVAQMQRTIIHLERRIKELSTDIKTVEAAFDESEALTEQYRLLLAQAKFYLENCKGCQNPEALKYLRAELPKYLVKTEHNDPLLLVEQYNDR